MSLMVHVIFMFAFCTCAYSSTDIAYTGKITQM